MRIAALGKKGRVPELMATLGALPGDQRKAFGQAVNGLKTRVSEALEGRKADLERGALTARLATEKADVTLPVRARTAAGRAHPSGQPGVRRGRRDLRRHGLRRRRRARHRDRRLNFTKLNIPPEHPARQEHDTFYMQGSGDDGDNDPVKVLRTHTSPVQIRTMMAQKPPIRIIVPGRVYRLDSDATHTPMFHQIEGLVIDETTHLGHLKWCLEEFCKAFFEVDAVRMRFRASHFPFTEPSMEVDIDAAAIGKPGQWLEILGSGMVHPNVIRNCGLDPDKYQGFAFGMGLDRIAMLKYGIPDLRDMFSADLRWLRHYGFTALDVPTLAGGLSGHEHGSRARMKFTLSLRLKRSIPLDHPHGDTHARPRITLSWLKDHLTPRLPAELRRSCLMGSSEASTIPARSSRPSPSPACSRPSGIPTPTSCRCARSTPAPAWSRSCAARPMPRPA